MFKIETLNAIAEEGLSQLSSAFYEVGAKVTNPDAILVRSFNLHHQTIPDSVKVIGRAGAGVNTIPLDTLTHRGVPVLNTPGANANAVRELVLAGMLIASRNIFQAWSYLHSLSTLSTDLEKQVEHDKKQFVGFELQGKKLAVIGLGSVGVKVANAAVALGMQVVGFDPTITIHRAWELSAEVKQAHSLTSAWQHADFITLHVPLTTETRHMLNASSFQTMKKGVIILNFAREGIIDNDALKHYLQDRSVFAYVNDFPNAELKDYPGVLTLPHLGASTKEAEKNCAVMIVQQVRAFLENGSIVNSVNFPEVEAPPFTSDVRLAIANENIPNMVAQISASLAKANLNITSLVNKSRDNIAYTLVDLNAEVRDETLREIAAIQGVLQIRQLRRV